MTLKIAGGRRVQRRKGAKVTPAKLQEWAATRKDFSLYWIAFKRWVFNHLTVTFRVTATFELAPADPDHPDRRGRFYWVRLNFVPDESIPAWFPTYDEMPANERNFLHISVCFTGDIEKMNDEDRDQAHRYIHELEAEWNGNTVWTTFVKHCYNSGTFHLAGFEKDERMRWLHEHGSYKNRALGHIALYAGGISR